jgi:hypothetical protein
VTLAEHIGQLAVRRTLWAVNRDRILKLLKRWLRLPEGMMLFLRGAVDIRVPRMFTQVAGKRVAAPTRLELALKNMEVAMEKGGGNKRCALSSGNIRLRR